VDAHREFIDMDVAATGPSGRADADAGAAARGWGNTGGGLDFDYPGPSHANSRRAWLQVRYSWLRRGAVDPKKI